MEKREGLPELIGGFIGDAIGWALCFALLAGLYFLGFAVAHYFGGEHRESFGLLSAFTMVWIYEHRRANDRWTRHFNQ